MQRSTLNRSLSHVPRRVSSQRASSLLLPERNPQQKPLKSGSVSCGRSGRVRSILAGKAWLEALGSRNQDHLLGAQSAVVLFMQSRTPALGVASSHLYQRLLETASQTCLEVHFLGGSKHVKLTVKSAVTEVLIIFFGISNLQ